MRKALWIIVSTLILCLCLSFAGHAEIPSVDLSTFSLEELNQVKADIASETKLHHETSAKVQEDVLKAVKAATEQYYSEKASRFPGPGMTGNTNIPETLTSLL